MPDADAGVGIREPTTIGGTMAVGIRIKLADDR
jgi:hypothetical protein